MLESDRHALSECLAAGIKALAIPVSAANQAQLIDYLRLLLRWNGVYNLSAVRDPESMVMRHLLDSLAILPWIDSGSLLDVGTGPGLPGIPLAIAQPGLAVTLLDSNGKKVRFLRQACIELALTSCTVVQARAEAVEGSYPLITARAFTSLAGFWRVAAARLAPGGRVLAMKGRYPREELSELTGLGVSWRSFSLEVPGLDAERYLLELTAEPATAPPRQD